jgi:hypothetical protein
MRNKERADQIQALIVVQTVRTIAFVHAGPGSFKRRDEREAEVILFFKLALVAPLRCKACRCGCSYCPVFVLLLSHALDQR